MKSRYHIWIDTYDKVIDMEAKTLAGHANTQVLPLPTISKPTLPRLDILLDYSQTSIKLVDG